MRTFREHSYDIVKLLINQVGIIIFSLFMYTAVGGAFDKNESLQDSFKLAVSVFAVLFYCVIVYCMFWDLGAKDAIRIAGGRTEYRPFKAVVIALWASIPNLILGFGAVIFALINSFASSDGIKNLLGIFILLCTWVMDMYLGIIQTLAPDSALLQAIMYLLLPTLVCVGTVQFGYFMGLKERKIFSLGSKK